MEGWWDLRPSATPYFFSLLADYLVSRAQAALDSMSALEKGHAQYLTSRAGEWSRRDRVGQGRGSQRWWARSHGHCHLLPLGRFPTWVLLQEAEQIPISPTLNPALWV